MNLHLNAREDEQFHLQVGEPIIDTYWQWGPFRYIRWGNIYTPSTRRGHWRSWWIWKLQIYWGNTKCDATRTYMYWYHQLQNDSHIANWYVMTTTPKEMKAFRWRAKGQKPVPDKDAWLDMGGL